MNVREIIEAIDDPSGLIHPEKHQAFATGNFPLGKHPAYPAHTQQPGQKETNYEEVLASRQWQKLLQKANQYLGVPLTRQSTHLIQQKLIGAMALIDQAESTHKEELEQLAVQLVFELPEFKSAKKAHDRNQIAIDANLSELENRDIDTQDMMTSDEPEAQKPLRQERTPAEQEWMKKMVQRRHFTNAMIHGSGVSNNFLFELAGNALDRLHPGLRKAYGILMISTEIGYWMFPQDMVIAGARAQTHVGGVRVNIEEVPEQEEAPEAEPEPGAERPPSRKMPVVHAQGACLPVLIQEIIKGLTELASLPSLPRDPEERQEVIDKADLVDMEAWSMMLGPKLWDEFVSAIDAENERELLFHLYGRIQQMDVDQFNGFMKEVLSKSPRGMAMLRDLATRVRAEIADDDDNGVGESQKIIEKLLEADDDLELNWKDTVELQTGTYSQPPLGLRAYRIEDAVRKLGIGGTEVSVGVFKGQEWPYVTVEFPEGSEVAPMTALFVTPDDAERFMEYIDRLDRRRRGWEA